jgi:xanthine phosphoribosyltransferase
VAHSDTARRAAAALADSIARRGRAEGPLLKVDEFLNHGVDPELLDLVGAGIAGMFEEAPDLVLTAEASGIPPALGAARAAGVGLVYAKKYPRGESVRPAFVRDVASPTKGATYRIEVSRRVLPPGAAVLVVDDFLSGGRTAEALASIVAEAGATLIGLGFAIEKSFTDGRERLEALGLRIESLVRVAALEPEIILEPGVVGAFPGHG